MCAQTTRERPPLSAADTVDAEPWAASGAFLRRSLGVAAEIMVNVALPFLIYTLAESRLGQAPALMIASSPPMAWTVVHFALRRRVDALSILVLVGIASSLLIFVAGGSVRFIQLREKLVTALVGLVFLGSAAIGRPLMYQLGRAVIQRRDPSGVGAYEAMKDDAGFRRTLTVMTLVWGAVLVADAVLAAALVLSLTVAQYLLVAPLLTYGVFGLLGLWSFLFVRRRRRAALARSPAGAPA